MKILLISSSFAALAFLPSCTDSHASTTPDAAAHENGAQFKKGQGVSLSEVMAKSIGLQVAEVQEEKLAPIFVTELQSVEKGKEVTGWLSYDQASRIQVGVEVGLKMSSQQSVIGKVTRIEKSSFASGGDVEVTVTSPVDMEPGTPVKGTFRLAENAGVAAVPTSALLTTAEGHFVYARNGEFYVRTPVKIGSVSDAHVEIIDGLYTGDEIVTTPVMSLWLAELQVLRGGKACTCGH